MAAAFELSRPEHQGRYEVTVYQMGWRLGGKGASGRGPAGRIEEHGLHLWMGFYENAFRLMRECYDELGRDPTTCPIATWEHAFSKAHRVGVTDQNPDGVWDIWEGVLPELPGTPGDPANPTGSPSVAEYMTRAVEMLRTLFDTIERNAAPTTGSSAGVAGSPAAGIDEAASKLLQLGEIASLTAVTQVLVELDRWIVPLAGPFRQIVLDVLDGVRRSTLTILESRLQDDPLLRRVWQIIDLTLATLRGFISSSLLTDPRGFDAIDDYDSREWLRMNGASDGSLRAGYLDALYDFGFSYQGGNPEAAGISAGQALRSMVRAFFSYRGTFFWRMEAGMGDIVFAPYYEVLSKRGVRFEFFHRLGNVGLGRDGDTQHVAHLDFDIQAEVRAGTKYEPLFDVKGLPCWPSQPDYAQLEDGRRIQTEGWDLEAQFERRIAGKKTLRVGEDFDLVVLGIGLGAVPYLCREIVDTNSRWRDMVHHVQTVATQAFQLWLDADMAEFGRPGDALTVSGFVEPFDTWADMSHLVPRESWQRDPESLAYFCNVLPDEVARGADTPAATETVRRNAIQFLERELRKIWPGLGDVDGFPWERLVDPEEDAGAPRSRSGVDRFQSQFWKANVQPSDRYALSVPGSSKYRISPLDRSYDNLTICGDWTACSFNAGCVEAATMSGRLAAHAISMSPRLDEIIGFDHP